jgi:hypothetical protein
VVFGLDTLISAARCRRRRRFPVCVAVVCIPIQSATTVVSALTTFFQHPAVFCLSTKAIEPILSCMHRVIGRRVLEIARLAVYIFAGDEFADRGQDGSVLWFEQRVSRDVGCDAGVPGAA